MTCCQRASPTLRVPGGHRLQAHAEIVAAIRCDPGLSRTPVYLDYHRYPSKTVTEAAFKWDTGRAVSGGCDGTMMDWYYTKIPKTTQGQRTCFERGTSRLIVWDDVKDDGPYRAGSRRRPRLNSGPGGRRTNAW